MYIFVCVCVCGCVYTCVYICIYLRVLSAYLRCGKTVEGPDIACKDATVWPLSFNRLSSVKDCSRARQWHPKSWCMRPSATSM